MPEKLGTETFALLARAGRLEPAPGARLISIKRMVLVFGLRGAAEGEADRQHEHGRELVGRETRGRVGMHLKALERIRNLDPDTQAVG
ncbi:MAG: hypothetical protein H0U67_11055, partial [Gemmatimonadetes bacterium]|nr:hypothetical protein [Gemmatimonadota bacterium]